MNRGYVYLVHPCRFLVRNEDVYKVGRSRCVLQRVKSYGRGSVLISSSIVSNAKLCEKALKRAMCKHYIWRRDIGVEYFQGNMADIATTFMEVVMQDPMYSHRDVIDGYAAENTGSEDSFGHDDISMHDVCDDNKSALNIKTRPEAQKKSIQEMQDDLVIMALEVCKDIVCYVPDLTSDGDGVFYYCDPKTNIWTLQPRQLMETLMTLHIDSHPSCSRDAMIYSHSLKGRKTIVKKVSEYITDPGFERKLDTNYHLFACQNGVFDMNLGKFRKARVEDMVMRTGTFYFSEDDASKYRHEVMEYLCQLFPSDEERGIVLSYIASLLYGKRISNDILALMSFNTVDNGKTTFMSFLRKFFGNLHRNIRFIDEKDTPNKLRLISGDEFSRNSKLNIDFIASALNIGHVGIILSLSQDACPTLDSKQHKLSKRMKIIPMRSRFVSKFSMANEPNIHKADCNISHKFKAWLSAFAEILVEHTRIHTPGCFIAEQV